MRGHHFCKNRSGTAAVEFAMLSPLFILFLMGIVAYGIYFSASNSIQQLAADAARTAIAGINSAERQQLASAFISRNAGKYPFVDTARLSVSVRDDAADPNQFVVAVRYDARNLPIWNILGDLPMPNTTISRNSTIRIGGI